MNRFILYSAFMLFLGGTAFVSCLPLEEEDIDLGPLPAAPEFSAVVMPEDSNLVVITVLSEGYFDLLWDLHGGNPKTSKEAGRKSDAKTGGGYADVKLVNGKPEFMSKDAKPANKGGTYWIREEDKVAFDDSKFKAGDEVASIAIAPFTGDRGDIKFAAKWANGKWTMEIARKLVTGSKTDVNFDDLKKSYGFGVAFFDNAQVRHAVVKEPMVLQFK